MRKELFDKLSKEAQVEVYILEARLDELDHEIKRIDEKLKEMDDGRKN